MSKETKTVMQGFIEYLDRDCELGMISKKEAARITWYIKTYFLEEERNQIEKSVNDTIDAYHLYVENPHNPPPMNGIDYYNSTYK